MKIFLLAALLSSLAYADDAKEAPKATDPVINTVKVEDSAAQALFERVRDAHARAIHRGAINSSAPRS